MKTLHSLLLAATSLTLLSLAQAADTPVPMAHFDHAYERVQKLFAAVPSGTTLEQQQFGPIMGSDATEYLRIFGITRISASGNTDTVSLAGPFNGKTVGGSKIQLDSAITFTFHKEQDGSLHCDDVSGLRIKPFALLGWMHLQQLTIRTSPEGNTIFEAQVKFLGVTVTKTKTISPDGQVLP